MKPVQTYVILISFVILSTNSQGQGFVLQDPVAIGKPCPDFTLTDIAHYRQPKVSLKDFRGKWLVLDFWTPGCISCVESFPKLNTLAKIFDEKVQILLIGRDDWNKNGTDKSKNIYERFRKRLNLQLSVAFDTAAFHLFNVAAVPYIVWINPKGIIEAITSATDLDSVNLSHAISGKKLNLTDFSNIKEVEQTKYDLYDYRKPFLINGNGGDDMSFAYRSVLSDYTTDLPMFEQPFISSVGYNFAMIKTNRVQSIGSSLLQLYQLAYGDTIYHGPILYNHKLKQPFAPSSYGTYWIKPLLEVSEPEKFETDYRKSDNFYCYSLIVPPSKATATHMQEIMQRDLQNYFGYDVAVETRMMPCWYLEATEEARDRLKTIGGKFSEPCSPAKIKLRNAPVYHLIRKIWEYHPGEPPIIDKTGITGNVDIDMDVIRTDFTDTQEALQRVGLSLVKSEKEMKVIVIRDKKNFRLH